MGYSHERGAAVRTILRIRAIAGDNRQVIEDAETAVSGYLDMEDFDSYAAAHAPDGLPDTDPAITLVRQRQHYYNAAVSTNNEVHDILAKALGYPLYQPGEPGYSPEQDNYITGDHVAESLAMEAAARIAEMERLLNEARR